MSHLCQFVWQCQLLKLGAKSVCSFVERPHWASRTVFSLNAHTGVVRWVGSTTSSFPSKCWTVLSIIFLLLGMATLIVVIQARIMVSLRQLHFKANRASVSIFWKGRCWSQRMQERSRGWNWPQSRRNDRCQAGQRYEMSGPKLVSYTDRSRFHRNGAYPKLTRWLLWHEDEQQWTSKVVMVSPLCMKPTTQAHIARVLYSIPQSGMLSIPEKR